MTKTIELLKGSRLGMVVIGVLCAVVLVSTMPQEAAAATLAEYALLLTLITVALVGITDLHQSPTAVNLLLGQLEASVEGARLANVAGDRHLELSRLSKTIGAAEALMGMTSSCDACGDLRSILQQIIGLAANMKTSVVGASGTCHPNGLIQPNEVCDPLAVPTGCPVGTVVTFCNDECLCQPVP